MKFSNFFQCPLDFLSEKGAWSSALILLRKASLVFLCDDFVVSTHSSSSGHRLSSGGMFPGHYWCRLHVLAECLWLYHAGVVSYWKFEGHWNVHQKTFEWGMLGWCWIAASEHGAWERWVNWCPILPGPMCCWDVCDAVSASQQGWTYSPLWQLPERKAGLSWVILWSCWPMLSVACLWGFLLLIPGM